ncbi:MAG: amidohydrolase [Ignavibacteriae bacterium]|nr:amidohydrolase [Ignavibacteriota bacterium]
MKKTNVIFLVFLISLTIISVSCSNQEHSADLVLTNGKIITVDNNNTITEAIAISADTILALGDKAEIDKYINSKTKIIDLKGSTVIPGFIDSHAHLISTGRSKLILNFADVNSWTEIVSMVAKAAKNVEPGEWIVGRGWHQEKWKSLPKPNIEGYPHHSELSKVSPNNPVLLSHASGHALFVNKFAMKLSNISKNTIAPKGGEIIKDKAGNPIGVFTEEAERLIWNKYNEHNSKRSKQDIVEDKKKAIHLAVDECLENGITSFHDAGSSFEDVEVYRELVDNNNLGLRLYVMLLEDSESLKKSIKKYFTIGYANNHLTVRAIKVYMDGALGSRGAWLLKPYTDMPSQVGLNVTQLSEINSIAQVAIENDFQVCTHAIGDRGNLEIISVYEKTFSEVPNSDNLRWRVEHAQHLDTTDIPRFSKLGIIASMQGIHCTSDAPFVEKRLGADRAKDGAYVWRSLINNGATICSGTDSPIEGIDPIKNIYATVTRKLKDGSSFYPDQKMNRLEALKSYTINGAYAAFEEEIKGSLEVGKLADIAVLSKDILTTPDEEILNTEILYTILGGKIVYEK